MTPLTPLTLLRRRRGIALVAALALMTLLAILIVGGAASASMARRSSDSSHADATLTAAADYAINTVLADHASYGLGDLPLGQAARFEVPLESAARVHATVAVTRLPTNVLWIVAEVTSAAADGMAQGRRRVNVLARFPSLIPEPMAALTARGAVRAGATVRFFVDSAPEADCMAPAVADVLMPPGPSLSVGDGTRVVRDAHARDSTYVWPGSQLALLTGAGFVRALGDTTIPGGAYEGILIVGGSVTFSGPFQLTGVLLARGRIVARSGSLTVRGAMMSYAAPAGADWGVDVTDGAFTYSRCAVQRFARGISPPRTIGERGWAELF